jgi:hypothetical protein
MSNASADYTIERYEARHKPEWDAFVRGSKNGTFLFVRDFMDYHGDRFADHSLVVRNQGATVALLPANRAGDELHSHQGLTYGGFVVADSMTTPGMVDVFQALLRYLRGAGIRRLHYKAIPSIYHRMPAEEDRYALFLAEAALSRRDVLTVIPLGRRGPVQSRRRRGAASAAKAGVVVREATDWKSYWALLTEHLRDRYGVSPVHSVEEIELLHGRFPQHIRLFEAALDSEVLAGVVIFESAMVAHVQYIAASERGRDAGALDGLFEHLIEQEFRAKPYFDFGISNEQQGRHLNRGLIEQKEGFGGRAVVHDFYMIEAILHEAPP